MQNYDNRLLFLWNEEKGVKNLNFNILQLVKKSSSGNGYVIGNETNDKQEYKLNLIK